MGLTSANSATTKSKPRLGALLRLAGWSAAVALFWLVLLPWIGSRPGISNHLEWLEEQGVDPSAMYYTDLEVMKPIRERLNVGLGIGGAEKNKVQPSATGSNPSPAFLKTEN